MKNVELKFRSLSFPLVFLSVPQSSLAKGSFHLLFPLSVTADIHIQLGSENPPNTAQILRYGILTLPTEFVDQPIRCEGLRGTYLEIQRKSKKQFIIQTLLLLWLPHLPQWKVACGSDYLPVSACQRRCCLPALWVAGTRSLCKCSA